MFQIKTETVFNLNNNSIRLQSKNSRELRHGLQAGRKITFTTNFGALPFSLIVSSYGIGI